MPLEQAAETCTVRVRGVGCAEPTARGRSAVPHTGSREKFMWAAIADAKDAAARAASEGAAAVAAARAAAELQAAALQEQASKAAEAAAEQASKAAGAAAEHAKKIDLSSIQEAVLFPGEEDTPSWETPARPAQKFLTWEQRGGVSADNGTAGTTFIISQSSEVTPRPSRSRYGRVTGP